MNDPQNPKNWGSVWALALSSLRRTDLQICPKGPPKMHKKCHKCMKSPLDVLEWGPLLTTKLISCRRKKALVLLVPWRWSNSRLGRTRSTKIMDCQWIELQPWNFTSILTITIFWVSFSKASLFSIHVYLPECKFHWFLVGFGFSSWKPEAVGISCCEATAMEWTPPTTMMASDFFQV